MRTISISRASSWTTMPNNVYTLLRVTAADGGAHLILTVEIATEEGTRQEKLSVLTSRLPAVPKPGTLSPEMFDLYREEAATATAITTGMRILSAGGNSKRALRQKLRQRGIASVAADAATEALADLGYLREEEGAVREAERGMDKLWGNRRILLDLRAKGYGKEAEAAALSRLACEDEVARCTTLITRRRMFPSSGDELSRTVSALMRYGYAVPEIKKALSRAAAKRFDHV